MSDTGRSKRAIPLDTDGVARLITEFNSHLDVVPRITLDPKALRPNAWDETALRAIRESVRDPQTGIVDIEGHIRALVLYTEIPIEVIRNISLLALGRIAQKLIHASGTLAFRHGTFLKVETDAEKAREVVGIVGVQDHIVANVWIPNSDLSQPPTRRVPLPFLDPEV